MISHALTIIMNELNKHLADSYGSDSTPDQPVVGLGNLAEGFVSKTSSNGVSRDMLYLSLINIREEKTLKNLPNSVRNNVTHKVTYENPPVYINCFILITATHTNYTNALSILSRAIRFFQSRNTFTQDTVAPDSITNSSVPFNPLDQLESFKLILDLYSPTMEEVNHLWGTLGGKQYPFVMYLLRMLELKFKTAPSEHEPIREVVRNLYHKNTETQ